jgi:putative tricarboxylic transport membrane protein
MALDRWIALVFVAFCCVYGYAAFFTMDQLLPPFMQRNPVWPSTFPKVLALLGILVGLIVALGLEKPDPKAPKTAPEINYRRLTDYKLGQALALLGAMVAYALILRPIGFLAATVLFLVAGGLILGERRILALTTISALAAGAVWYLVQEVLGIFLTPLPAFL